MAGTYAYPEGQQSFEDKDALPAGSAGKVVRGSDVGFQSAAITTGKLDKTPIEGDFTGVLDGGRIEGGSY
jgi:hypothetical protein